MEAVCTGMDAPSGVSFTTRISSNRCGSFSRKRFIRVRVSRRVDVVRAVATEPKPVKVSPPKVVNGTASASPVLQKPLNGTSMVLKFWYLFVFLFGVWMDCDFGKKWLV